MPSFVKPRKPPHGSIEETALYIAKHLPWPAVVHASVSPNLNDWSAALTLYTMVEFCAEEVAELNNSPNAAREFIRRLMEMSMPPSLIDRRPHLTTFWCAHHEALVSAEHMNGCRFTRNDKVPSEDETLFFWAGKSPIWDQLPLQAVISAGLPEIINEPYIDPADGMEKGRVRMMRASLTIPELQQHREHAPEPHSHPPQPPEDETPPTTS